MSQFIDNPREPPNPAKDGEIRKWEFLRNAPKNDALTHEIRMRSYHLREATKGSAWPQWAFVALCAAIARDAIVYQLDSDRVGREQIDGFTDPQGRADEPYMRGRDDCDAKARFFVALCLAGDIQAAMVDRWKLVNGVWELAHVYARALYQAPGENVPQWHPVETILARARLNETPEQVPKEPDTGNWRFSS